MLKNIFLLVCIISILREGESANCKSGGPACSEGQLCKFTRGSAANSWKNPVCDSTKKQPTCEGKEEGDACWCTPGTNKCSPAGCTTDAECTAKGPNCGPGKAVCTGTCKFIRQSSKDEWKLDSANNGCQANKASPACEGVNKNNACWCKPGAEGCKENTACKTDDACKALLNCKANGAACTANQLCEFTRGSGTSDWTLTGSGCVTREKGPNCEGKIQGKKCWCTPGADACNPPEACKNDDGCDLVMPKCSAGGTPCTAGQLCKFKRGSGGPSDWHLDGGCDNKTGGPTCEGKKEGKFCWCTPGFDGCNPAGACKTDAACGELMKKNTNMRIAPSLISFLIVVVFGLTA